MFEICKIEWNEIMWMVERLADKLQDKRVWGIPRGGQIVATLMAYHGCKLVEFATSADVIVDDIADTGQTLFKRTHNTKISTLGLPTAALIVRQGCAATPNHWVMVLNIKDYIMFPWETEQEHITFMNTHYKGEHSE